MNEAQKKEVARLLAEYTEKILAVYQTETTETNVTQETGKVVEMHRPFREFLTERGQPHQQEIINRYRNGKAKLMCVGFLAAWYEGYLAQDPSAQFTFPIVAFYECLRIELGYNQSRQALRFDFNQKSRVNAKLLAAHQQWFRALESEKVAI